jgi:F-type H+-transporting ATPase subunit a
MASHSFWFATLLNKLFGSAVSALLVQFNALLVRIGFPAQHPVGPIPNYVAEEILVMIIIIIGAVILRTRLSAEKPGRFQLAIELVVDFTRNMIDEVIGKGGRRYVALVATLGIFIGLCNLLGLIPALDSPTAHGGVTLGCAALVYFYYNFQGFRQHGVIGYLKHLGGPMMAIAVIMFPVEVFSSALRMLSLSVRLWANMYVGGMLERLFTGLIPVLLPAIFMALHVFESFLQAYIFMILPVLYIALALQTEH